MELGMCSAFDEGYVLGYKYGVDFHTARDEGTGGGNVVPRDAQLSSLYTEGWGTGAAKRQEEERIKALSPVLEPVVKGKSG